MKLVNLIPLKEIDFRNQDQFDAYQKKHSLRPDTKVTIAGKVTTAGQAAKNSEPVKGTSVFGKDKGGSVFGKSAGASTKSDKSKPKEISNDDVEALTSYKDFNKFFKANSDKLNKDDVSYIEDEIGALKYLESDYKRGDADWEEVEVAYIDLQDLIKKAMGNDNNDDWMNDLDSIDVSDIKGKADPNADSWTHGDVFGATFKDPQTGKPISVGDAYDREDDSPAYQKAFAYVAQFNPDDEAVMGTQAYNDLQKNAAPKADTKSIIKSLLKTADKEFAGAYKLKDVVDDFKDSVDDSDNDGKELKARLDKGENGVYVQTDETEGTVVFDDGSQYQFSRVEDGPIPVTKVGSTKLSEMIPKNIKK